jgi:hypothetical protein
VTAYKREKDSTVQTVRLADDLYHKVRVKIAEERMRSFQELVLTLLSTWLHQDTGTEGRDTGSSSRKDSLESSGPGTAISPLSNSVWHDMLDRILASKHRPAIEAIVRNLHAFDILVNTDEKGRDDAYAVPLLLEEVAEFYPDIAKTLEDLEEAKRQDREGTKRDPGRDRTRGNRRAG